MQSDAGSDVQSEVLRALAGLRLGRVTSREPTLEDAYVAIVSSGVADAKVPTDAGVPAAVGATA